MAIICANGVIYFARKSISSKNFQGTLSYPKKKKKRHLGNQIFIYVW